MTIDELLGLPDELLADSEYLAKVGAADLNTDELLLLIAELEMRTKWIAEVAVERRARERRRKS